MNCPPNCEVCKRKLNPWLLYNERIRDFIRWKELGYFVVLYAVFILWLGWWGIVMASILDWLMHMCGGPVIDLFGEYPKEEPSDIKCVAGHKDCPICDENGDFDYKKLKWYEQII